MSKPVNLNQFRKAKARVKKRAQANENAVKFGRTKAEKELVEARAKKAQQTINHHKLDDDQDGA